MKKYPFISVIIFFITGIILGKFIPSLFILFIAALSLIIFFILLKIIVRSLPTNIIKNLIILTLSLLSGVIVLKTQGVSAVNYPFKNSSIKDVILFGSISDFQLMSKGTLSGIVDADSIMIKNRIEKLKAKILVKITDENPKRVEYLYQKIKIGNQIKCKGFLYAPPGIKNPGDFDYKKYLYEKGITAIVSVNHFENFRITSHDVDRFANLIFSIRKIIDERLRMLYEYKSYSLLKGLLLADRSEMDYKVKENFMNAGVVHVLAVSGLHVGYIVLIFLVLFNRFNYMLKYLLTIIGIVIFILITGAHAPVVRASIMAIIIILTQLTNRSSNGLNSLAIAAFLILLFDPNQLFSPGFQLSFSAVLSILIFYPVFRNFLYSLNISQTLNKILLFMAISFAAQIGTLPFTLYYFNRLSFIALFANLIVIPVIGFILALGIISLVVSVVWMWGATVFSAANYLLISLLFDFINFTGSLKISHVFINRFSVYDSILFYVALILLFLTWKYFNHRFSKLLLIVLLTANYFVFTKINAAVLLPPKILSVMPFALRYGFSTFIKLPDGKVILVNSGKADKKFSPSKRIIEPFLKRINHNLINYAIATSVNKNLTGGFNFLFNKKAIDVIYKPPPDSLNNEDYLLENEIDQFQVNKKYLSKEPLNISNCRFYYLKINKRFKSKNSNVFLKIVYGKTSFLFADLLIRVNSKFNNKMKRYLKSDVLIVELSKISFQNFKKILEIVKPLYVVVNDSILRNTIIKEFTGKLYNLNNTGATLFRSDGNTIKRIDWKYEFH